MIRRLQARLTLLSLGSLFVILLVLVVSVNILNYHRIVFEADQIATILAQNGGQPIELKRSDTAPKEVSPKKDTPKQNTPKQNAFPFSLPPRGYNDRFVSALLDAQGEILDLNLAHAGLVDSEQIISYLHQFYQKGAQTRFFHIYRAVSVAEGQGMRVVLLDCAPSLANYVDFLSISAGISLMVFGLVTVPVILFSRQFSKPVEQSYVRQKQFITDAGHEIKTPLAVIRADVDVLELEQGQSEWTDDIRAEIARLTDLTDQLICLSKLEEVERFERAMPKLSLSELVCEQVRSFGVMAKVSDKPLVHTVEEGVWVQGDARMLQQLCDILLENAIKYTEKEIGVSLARRGRYAALEVCNPCQELTSDELPNLFERFYRHDSARSAAQGGYGLGLSIAKAIVTRHKGKITASMQHNRLTICVLLPMA